MIPGRRAFWGRDARMILGERYKIYTLTESLLPFVIKNMNSKRNCNLGEERKPREHSFTHTQQNFSHINLTSLYQFVTHSFLLNLYHFLIDLFTQHNTLLSLCFVSFFITILAPAAITKYYKLDSLRTTEIYFSQLWEMKL